MNELLRRGIVAYKVIMKNKLAMSLMMFFSGVMMFIAAIQGRGNDTKTLPLLILVGGIVFSFWALYRIGYLKSNFDRALKMSQEGTSIVKRALFLQIIEALVYVIVAAVGVFLLINEDFTNQVLNLMAGGFMVLNGVFGVMFVVKNRDRKNFWWFFRIGLTLLELGFGLYFVICSKSIEITSYMFMGILTTVAGVIEVVTAIKMGGIKSTIQDSKEILEIMKDGKNA